MPKTTISGQTRYDEDVKKMVPISFQRLQNLRHNSGDDIIILPKHQHTIWKKNIKKYKPSNMPKATMTEKEKNDIQAYCLMIMNGKKKEKKKAISQIDISCEETMTND